MRPLAAPPPPAPHGFAVEHSAAALTPCTWPGVTARMQNPICSMRARLFPLFLPLVSRARIGTYAAAPARVPADREVTPRLGEVWSWTRATCSAAQRPGMQQVFLCKSQVMTYRASARLEFGAISLVLRIEHDAFGRPSPISVGGMADFGAADCRWLVQLFRHCRTSPTQPASPALHTDVRPCPASTRLEDKLMAVWPRRPRLSALTWRKRAQSSRRSKALGMHIRRRSRR